MALLVVVELAGGYRVWIDGEWKQAIDGSFFLKQLCFRFGFSLAEVCLGWRHIISFSKPRFLIPSSDPHLMIASWEFLTGLRSLALVSFPQTSWPFSSSFSIRQWSSGCWSNFTLVQWLKALMSTLGSWWWRREVNHGCTLCCAMLAGWQVNYYTPVP